MKYILDLLERIAKRYEDYLDRVALEQSEGPPPPPNYLEEWVTESVDKEIKNGFRFI